MKWSRHMPLDENCDSLITDNPTLVACRNPHNYMYLRTYSENQNKIICKHHSLITDDQILLCTKCFLKKNCFGVSVHYCVKNNQQKYVYG